MAFVPTSDCRFNCHGMIYVSEGKLIVTNFQLLAPLFLSPAGGTIAPPAPPGHHALLTVVDNDGAEPSIITGDGRQHDYVYATICLICYD